MTRSSNTPQLPMTALPGAVQDILATLLTMKGRTKEAIAHRRAALEKLEGALGPDHPELQVTLEQLAREHLQMEDFESAAEILRRTYDYRALHLGYENWDTLKQLALLTDCLLRAGQDGAAQPLLEHQLSVSERVLGPDHKNTLHAAQQLAVSHDRQGDHAKAEALLQRAEDGFERILGLTHPRTLACLYIYSEVAAKGTNPAAAERLGEKLVSASLLAHGASHHLTIEAVAILAQRYAQRRDFVAATAVVRNALAAIPPDRGPLSVAQAELQSQLAAYLDLAGNSDEAYVFAKRAAYALYGHLGSNDSRTKRAYRHLGDLVRRRHLRTPWGRFRLRFLHGIGRLGQLFQRGQKSR